MQDHNIAVFKLKKLQGIKQKHVFKHNAVTLVCCFCTDLLTYEEN